MYNQIRDYLRNPTVGNQQKMARAIAKNKAAGTISDIARTWLKAYQEKTDLKAVENQLKEFFRVSNDEV
jgi:hypothetical protein